MNSSFRRPTQTGFTLIELMVTIGLFMLAIGGVLANYNGFHTRQKVKQAALTFKEQLRFAQSDAVTGKKPTDITITCNILNGYQVSFTNETTYTVVTVCDDNALTDASEIQTYTLPSSIKIVLPATTITFQSLNGKINTGTDVSYTLTGDNVSYKITVSSSGDITDSGFVP